MKELQTALSDAAEFIASIPHKIGAMELAVRCYSLANQCSEEEAVNWWHEATADQHQSSNGYVYLRMQPSFASCPSFSIRTRDLASLMRILG
jgi:hypothetical protein